MTRHTIDQEKNRFSSSRPVPTSIAHSYSLFVPRLLLIHHLLSNGIRNKCSQPVVVGVVWGNWRDLVHSYSWRSSHTAGWHWNSVSWSCRAQVSRAAMLDVTAVVKSTGSVQDLMAVSTVTGILTTNLRQRDDLWLVSRLRVTWGAAESADSLIPSGLVSEASLGAFRLWAAVRTRNSAVEWDMVEAEVPDGSVHHAVRDESGESTDEGTSKAVVPVVAAINAVCAADEEGTKEWCEHGNELPHSWVIVRHDLEFGVEVEGQEHQAGKGGSGLAAWEGLEGTSNLKWISSADGAVVVDLSEAPADIVAMRLWWQDRVADFEEVWSDTAD